MALSETCYVPNPVDQKNVTLDLVKMKYPNLFNGLVGTTAVGECTYAVKETNKGA